MGKVNDFFNANEYDNRNVGHAGKNIPRFKRGRFLSDDFTKPKENDSKGFNFEVIDFDFTTVNCSNNNIRNTKKNKMNLSFDMPCNKALSNPTSEKSMSPILKTTRNQFTNQRNQCWKNDSLQLNSNSNTYDNSVTLANEVVKSSESASLNSFIIPEHENSFELEIESNDDNSEIFDLEKINKNYVDISKIMKKIKAVRQNCSKTSQNVFDVRRLFYISKNALWY